MNERDMTNKNIQLAFIFYSQEFQPWIIIK